MDGATGVAAQTSSSGARGQMPLSPLQAAESCHPHRDPGAVKLSPLFTDKRSQRSSGHSGWDRSTGRWPPGPWRPAVPSHARAGPRTGSGLGAHVSHLLLSAESPGVPPTPVCLLRLRQRVSPAQGHGPGTRLTSVSLSGVGQQAALRTEPVGPGRLVDFTPRVDSSDATRHSCHGGFRGAPEQGPPRSRLRRCLTCDGSVCQEGAQAGTWGGGGGERPPSAPAGRRQPHAPMAGLTAPQTSLRPVFPVLRLRREPEHAA